MNKHFNPAISEEKFAAWLDGMLPADEMQKVSSLVKHDQAMHDIYASSVTTDDDLTLYENESALHEDNFLDSFELPSLNDNFQQLFETENYEDGWHDDFRDLDIFSQEQSVFNDPLNKDEIGNTDLEVDHYQNEAMLDSNIEE